MAGQIQSQLRENDGEQVDIETAGNARLGCWRQQLGMAAAKLHGLSRGGEHGLGRDEDARAEQIAAVSWVYWRQRRLGGVGDGVAAMGRGSGHGLNVAGLWALQVHGLSSG
ncbi:hypothetical protein M0R45_002071 [Rubus argutus]|uniref:Uncharacterized protein n=1 Tax=Rubus argutus TaxID=59490 RepID=A0AAW1VKB1_RUBAR